MCFLPQKAHQVAIFSNCLLAWEMIFRLRENNRLIFEQGGAMMVCIKKAVCLCASQNFVYVRVYVCVAIATHFRHPIPKKFKDTLLAQPR